MKLQYVRAFIVLLAGLIALIVNIKTGRDITISLLIVLIVILGFYFLGTLAVELIQRSMNNDSYRDHNQSNDNDMKDESDDSIDSEANDGEEFSEEIQDEEF